MDLGRSVPSGQWWLVSQDLPGERGTQRLELPQYSFILLLPTITVLLAHFVVFPWSSIIGGIESRLKLVNSTNTGRCTSYQTLCRPCSSSGRRIHPGPTYYLLTRIVRKLVSRVLATADVRTMFRTNLRRELDCFVLSSAIAGTSNSAVAIRFWTSINHPIRVRPFRIAEIVHSELFDTHFVWIGGEEMALNFQGGVS